MIRAIRVVWLVAVWLVLWSDLSFANLVSGLLVALAIVAAFDTWRAGSIVVRPLAALRFGCHFAVALATSAYTVARTVVAPRDRVHRGIVAVPLQGCSDAVATIIADAISLTPGTLTLEVRRDPLTLFVHALDTRDVEQVRRDVRRLEVLAVRAFGDDAALAGLEVDDSTAWEAR